MDGQQSSRTQWYHFQHGRRTRMSLGRMELVNGPPNNFFQLRDPIPSRRELHQRIMLLPSCDRTPRQNCVGGDTSCTNADHESASVGQISPSGGISELASVSKTDAGNSRSPAALGCAHRVLSELPGRSFINRQKSLVLDCGTQPSCVAQAQTRRLTVSLYRSVCDGISPVESSVHSFPALLCEGQRRLFSDASHPVHSSDRVAVWLRLHTWGD